MDDVGNRRDGSHADLFFIIWNLSAFSESLQGPQFWGAHKWKNLVPMLGIASQFNLIFISIELLPIWGSD